MAALSTDIVGFVLDADGDLDVFALSRGEWSTGLDAVAQGIQSRILLVKGEWFLDLEDGVPWFEGEQVPSSEAIIGGRFDQARVRDIISAQILATPNVRSIVSLAVTFNPTTRVVVVQFKARTTFGDLAGSVEV